MDCLVIAGIIIVVVFVASFTILPYIEKKYGIKFKGDDFI